MPCSLLYHPAERSGREYFSAFFPAIRLAATHLGLLHALCIFPVDLLASTASTPLSDMDALASSLQGVLAQLERVLGYVRAVLAGEREGDAVVGRYIMDTISVVPGGMDAVQLETLFNSHLQVSHTSWHDNGGQRVFPASYARRRALAPHGCRRVLVAVMPREAARVMHLCNFLGTREDGFRASI